MERVSTLLVKLIVIFCNPLISFSLSIYNVVGSADDILYTKDELAEYDGSSDSPGLYLGILGRVYDVSAGKKHYGENGGYSFFRAKDGTRAFMTGEFNEEGLIDDVEGLLRTQMLELEDWIKFYDKSYTYKGKLIGRFYDDGGNPTLALQDAVSEIEKAHIEKQEAEKEKAKMPPCNSEQNQHRRRVWCSTKSGGIQRDWVGFPRKFFKQGDSYPRCVCVHQNDLANPHFKEYDNCDPQATSCELPKVNPNTKQEL